MAFAQVSSGLPGTRVGAPGAQVSVGVRGIPQASEPTPYTASRQSEALRNPEPVVTSTPVNPMQSESFGMTRDSYGAAKGLADSITGGTNEEINRELGRARDETSVGIKKEGEAAMGRGADAALFRGRAAAAGARDMGNLQARLAGVALDKKQAAVNSQVGASGNAANAAAQAAGEQRSLALGTSAQRLADSREVRERAESQARLDQAPFDRMLSLMSTVGQFGGAFSGLTGGPNGTGSPLSGPVGPTVERMPTGGFGRTA